ncbi:MAG: GNAT family N-acetyltransferase [Sphingobacteriaceae bacterium]|nr:GNAT family N-acetyltransferase [Sphingobacteriaceae bacterium]
MSDRIPTTANIQIKEISDSVLLKAVFEIRQKVFVEEQAVDPEEEYDEFEDSSRHFLLLAGGKPCATGRFRSTDKGWKIERMAVLAEERGNGYGGMVLQKMLEQVPQDERPIYLHAQEHALSFYQRHHFKAVGERFWEANIPHFKCVWQAPAQS